MPAFHRNRHGHRSYIRRCVSEAGRHGFTLIELLAVVGIIAVISVLAVSAFVKLTTSSGVSVGGSLVVDQLNLARQIAISRNCQVEFRIYKLPDETKPGSTSPEFYRAMQIFTLDNVKGTATPVSKAVFLPRNIVFFEDTTVSSLLKTESPPFTLAGSSTAEKFVGFDPSTYVYTCFEFNPDGSTDLNPTKNWFVSLASSKEKVVSGQQLPANFFTVQVDPANGRIRNFRPNQ